MNYIAAFSRSEKEVLMLIFMYFYSKPSTFGIVPKIIKNNTLFELKLLVFIVQHFVCVVVVVCVCVYGAATFRKGK